MRKIAELLRANPQLALLLAITIVLGVGTFLAVVLSLAGSGHGAVAGQPSGSIGVFQTMLAYCQWLSY
ncbi:MAG: hypothetical protein M3Y17_11895 [Actinomycetota bacterium]|nr:hypothetical protein [Actinomycetota bacterium]